MNRSKFTYLPVYASGIFGLSPQVMALLLVPLWAVRLEASPLWIGLSTGAGSVLAAVFSISLGSLVDRVGAKRVILYGAFTAMVLAGAFPLFPYIGALVVIQLLYGFVSTMSWIGCQTYTAKLSEKSGDASHSGNFGFFVNAGMFIGPLGLGYAWDVGGPALAFGALAFWNLTFWAIAWLMPSDPGERAEAGRAAGLRQLLPRWSDYRRAAALLTIPAVGLVVYGTFLRLSGYAIRGSFYLVYLEQLEFSGTAIGFLYAFLSLVSVFSALLTNRLSRYLGEWKLLVAALVISILPISVTPMFDELLPLLLLSAVAGFGAGLTMPLLISILARSVRPQDQGLAVGLRNTTNGVAATMVPIMLGVVVEALGLDLAFYVAGALLIVPMLIVYPMMLRAAPDAAQLSPGRQKP